VAGAIIQTHRWEVRMSRVLRLHRSSAALGGEELKSAGIQQLTEQFIQVLLTQGDIIQEYGGEHARQKFQVAALGAIVLAMQKTAGVESANATVKSVLSQLGID